MDVREKLVELLNSIIDGGFKWHSHLYESGEQLNNDEIASHLIDHGVTVQEWVPVSERLPEIPEGWAESPDCVLYMMKNTKTIYAGYYGEGGVWRDKYFRQYADSRNGVDVDDVICWMYQHDLPQPPKGE